MALSLVKTHGHPFPSYLLLNKTGPAARTLHAASDLCPPCSITALWVVFKMGIIMPIYTARKIKAKLTSKGDNKELSGVNNASPSSVQWYVEPWSCLGPSRMGVILALFPTPS